MESFQIKDNYKKVECFTNILLITSKTKLSKWELKRYMCAAAPKTIRLATVIVTIVETAFLIKIKLEKERFTSLPRAPPRQEIDQCQKMLLLGWQCGFHSHSCPPKSFFKLWRKRANNAESPQNI